MINNLNFDSEITTLSKWKKSPQLKFFYFICNTVDSMLAMAVHNKKYKIFENYYENFERLLIVLYTSPIPWVPPTH